MKLVITTAFLLILSIGIADLALCPVTNVHDHVGDRVQVIITAYSSTPDQTDNSPYITASGRKVRPGILAVSRDLKGILNFGQIVYLEGIGYFVVEDVMHERWTNRVDIWFSSKRAALRFGVKKGMLRWDKKTISFMGNE